MNPKLKKALLPFYHFANGISRILKASYLDALKNPLFVGFYSWFKFTFLIRPFRKINTFSLKEGHIVGSNTISHNLKGLEWYNIYGFAGLRPKLLFRQISLIESIDKSNSKLLIIGPRADSELLLARAFGFNSKNVRGLDLISYSSRVDLGDMHDMPYKDNSWDVILLGWVIAYSSDPKIAAKEIIRVAKNSTIVSIGVQYSPSTIEEVASKKGYIPGSNFRITSTDQILSYFEDHVGYVYFKHDITEKMKNETGEITVTFSINKNGDK